MIAGGGRYDTIRSLHADPTCDTLLPVSSALSLNQSHDTIASIAPWCCDARDVVILCSPPSASTPLTFPSWQTVISIRRKPPLPLCSSQQPPVQAQRRRDRHVVFFHGLHGSHGLCLPVTDCGGGGCGLPSPWTPTGRRQTESEINPWTPIPPSVYQPYLWGPMGTNQDPNSVPRPILGVL